MGNILKNSFFLLLAKGINPVLSSVFIIVLARSLGANELGAYTLVLSWVAIFEIFSGLGLRPLLVRKISQKSEKWQLYFTGGCFLGLLCSSLLAILIVTSCYFLELRSSVKLGFTLLAISLFPSTFNYIIQSVLYAKENMKAPAMISVAEVVIKVVVGVTVLVLLKSLLLVFLTVLLSKVFSSLFLFLVLKKEMGSIKFRWDKRFNWSLFKSTLTFTAITVVAATYWRLDILMLSSMTDEAAVGFYSAAYRFFAIALLISQSYVIAFFPIISKLHLESSQKFRYVCGKSIKLLFIALVPVTLGLWLFGHNLITLIYGGEFSASFAVFRILILALVPMAIAQIFARTLLASGNQKVDLIINVVGLGLNFMLNLFFIPKYGIVGAALATLIVTFANLAILTGILWQKLFDARNILTGLKLLFAGILLIGITYWLQDTPLILKLIIPLLVYGVFLMITGSIDRAEKIWLLQGLEAGLIRKMSSS